MRLEVAKLNEKKTKKLSDRIEIAIGMKAMILANLSTEADVANGTRGTIKGIILDPREERSEPDEDGAIRLTFPPALILFEPDGGSQISSAFVDKRERHSINIPEGQIPLTPCVANFTVTMRDGSKLSVGRQQYALTGGYAFTDIKSQGQTIEVLVVDLRNTPTGKISPFSAYVALSRSRGRGTIRLLSDFDDKLFQTHPNADLEAEMQRLQLIAARTMYL
jgi:ATP-dependent exoDNAse (exonuclease V) alpha subunit